MLLAIIAVFGIVTILISFNQSFAEEEEQKCIFTAHIEKSWVFFPDRPWVTGSVINCDSNEYHEKDRVFVRILNINGDLVEDNWLPDHTTTRSIDPEKYIFTDHVYRKGSYTGNYELGLHGGTISIRPNQYFFYLPQIHSIDFDHRGIYQIELTYGNHVRTVWFATFSPDISWKDDEKKEADPCVDYTDKLIRLNNTLTALKKELTR